MLPKKNRADKREVGTLFKGGKFVISPSLMFRFIKKDKLSEPRISFIVPKNIAKLAVKRNLLRRKGYSILEKNLKGFPLGLVGVFVFKKYQEDILILKNEVKTILDKIN